MDLNKLMEQIYEELATSLLNKVRSGEATAADLNVIRQFLKDNGITGTPKKGSPFGELVDNLPDLPSDMTMQ